MITRKSAIKKHLESFLDELVRYYNRLEIDISLLHYDQKEHPRFRKNRLSISQLLIGSHDEPGLTKTDLLSYNTTRTENYEDFQDRFAEFFENYGILLTQYDNGDVYIFITDVEKYLILLSDLKSITNKSVLVAFVKKIDLGIENSIHQSLLSLTHLDGHDEYKEIIETTAGTLIRSIPKIVQMHDEFDPNTQNENLYTRKRLTLLHDAFVNGYLKPYLMLENYLSENEVGNKSRLSLLGLQNDTVHLVDAWRHALLVLKAVINIHGLPAKPIVDKVKENLAEIIDNLKKVADKNIAKYFEKEFEEMMKLKLKNKTLTKYIKPVHKNNNDHMVDIVNLVRSHFFSEKELKVLAGKILKIKNGKRRLPF